jgi:hypothetical protein
MAMGYEDRRELLARARDHIAECVDVFHDHQRVHQNRIGRSKNQGRGGGRERSVRVACDRVCRTDKHTKAE